MTAARRSQQAGLAPEVAAITRSDIVSPLAVLFSLMVLVLAVGVHFAVRSFDIGNQQREQTLASHGIEQRVGEVSLLVAGQVDWDEAVRNLDNSFDAVWAQANIGKFLTQTDGFDRSLVIGSDDKIVSAYRGGAAVAAGQFQPIQLAAINLIRSVRQAEAKRPPFPVTPAGEMISRPIQSSAIKVINGEPSVMTATLVQPDFGKARPSGARAPIVVTTMPVNSVFLDAFARRYLLKRLHIVEPSALVETSEASIPLRDENGALMATLVWEPLNPGYSMLRSLAVPMLAVSAGLLAVGFFQMRRVSKLAGKLIDAQDHWHSVASHDPDTELPNRIYLVEQLAFELSCLGEEGHSLALIGLRITTEIPVDAEKMQAISSIAAKRLARICREEALLAHLSLSTLGILCVGAGETEAAALARRIISVLTNPMALDSGEIVNVVPVVAKSIVTGSHGDADDIVTEIERLVALGRVSAEDAECSLS